MENIKKIGKKCIYCGNCLLVCSKRAISYCVDKEGFKYPLINNQLCINCGICLKNCPIISFKKVSSTFNNKFYFGNSKNEKVLLKTSSGGIFYEIAKMFFDIYENGKVCGVDLNKNINEFHAEHVITLKN